MAIVSPMSRLQMLEGVAVECARAVIGHGGSCGGGQAGCCLRLFTRATNEYP